LNIIGLFIEKGRRGQLGVPSQSLLLNFKKIYFSRQLTRIIIPPFLIY
jgi:hypothetical protein